MSRIIFEIDQENNITVKDSDFYSQDISIREEGNNKIIRVSVVEEPESIGTQQE